MVIKDSLQFETNLYNLINSCGLPIDTAYYVLKSVYLDFQRTLYEYAEKDQGGFTTEEQILKLEDEKIDPVNISMDIKNGEKGENQNEQTDTNIAEYSGSTDDN